MKADTVRIPYKYGQEFKLIPLFDIHLGNKSCDKRKLKEDNLLDRLNSLCYNTFLQWLPALFLV